MNQETNSLLAANGLHLGRIMWTLGPWDRGFPGLRLWIGGEGLSAKWKKRFSWRGANGPGDRASNRMGRKSIFMPSQCF